MSAIPRAFTLLGSPGLGTGDVVGPASATDNAIVRFDGTTGKGIQNSGCTIDDSNNMTVGGNLTVSGTGTHTFAGSISITGTLYGAGGTFTYLTKTLPYYGVDWQDFGDSGPRGTLSAYGGLQFFTAGQHRMAIPEAGGLVVDDNLTVSGTSAQIGTTTGVLYFGTPSNNYLYYDGAQYNWRLAGSDRFTLTSALATINTAAQVNGNLTVSGTRIVSTDTLSGAGAVSVTKDTTKLISTGAGQAITLADGTDGQIKHIIHDVDGGSMVLTPTTKTGYTTITFTNAGDSVTLEFVTTRGWIVVGSFGVTIA